MARILRRELLGMAAGAAASCAVPISAARRQPNVIIMLADDLGYGDLGCYGQRRIRTPNADRLAAEGIRFTGCYSGSTVCAPSRSCLVTGRHTGHTTVRGNDYVPLLPTDPSLGRLMRSAGYRTAVIGKWGLGEPGTTGVPGQQGFDEFYGYLNQVAAHDSFPVELWRNDRREPIPANADGRKGAYSNDLFRDEALAFVERNRRRPFLLLWTHTIPHAFPARHTIETPQIEPEYRRALWPAIEKRYASVITRMDRHLGQLMERLARLAIERDTIILFTSDNGPQSVPPHDPGFFQSAGALRGIKRDLYEGGIRVPGILRWPGHAPAGAVSASPWAFWDLLPTMAELTGSRAPAGTDGVSVLPLWLGRAARPHPPLYWEFTERGFEQAVRMGRWKAVRHAPGKRLELYDLERDPAEGQDVAASNPGVAAQVEAFLARARTRSDMFPNP